MDRIEIRFNSPFLAVAPAYFASDFTTNTHIAEEKGLRECWNFFGRNFLVRTIYEFAKSTLHWCGGSIIYARRITKVEEVVGG